MASITTTYAGRAHIAPGTGDQQAAFAAALVAQGEHAPGYDLGTFVLRVTAAGVPLWARRIGQADLSFMVRQASTQRSKRRGTVHVFAHRAQAGALETCDASGDAQHGACKAQATSKGDSVRRWRCDSDSNGQADARIASLDARGIAQAFAANIAAQAAYLRGRGHSVADMLDTPGIAQRREAAIATGIDAAMFDTMLSGGENASKAKSPAKSRASKAATPAK